MAGRQRLMRSLVCRAKVSPALFPEAGGCRAACGAGPGASAPPRGRPAHRQDHRLCRDLSQACFGDPAGDTLP